MKFWKKIAHFGVTDDMPMYKQKSTIFFNIAMRISVIMMILLAAITFFFADMIYLPIAFLIGIPFVGFSLFLNYKGKVNISVFITSIFFPLYFLGMSLFSKMNNEGLTYIFQITPRFGIVAMSVCSFAVLGFLDIKKAFIGIIAGMAILLIFDLVHDFFNVGLNETGQIKSFFIFLRYFYAGLLFFFSMIIFVLQKINSQYEKIVIAQRDQLTLRNAEIISQKEEIETQRDEIEAQRDEVTGHRDKIQYQNKQITSSITYASRIQQAMLPDSKVLANYFPNHFIIYKPRDIVSGDFYWSKIIKQNNNSSIIIAAADCTGHGVPGAFVSMLGMSFLNEIVSRMNIYKASEILNILRDEIKTSLKQYGNSNETKDGMDIALCIISQNEKKLQYAGAHNSLYIIRKNEISMDKAKKQELTKQKKIKFFKPNSKTEFSQLIEIKADHQPIGIFIKERPFTNIELEIFKDDRLFIFSDGFVDQFGGEKGKKYKSKKFKQKLLDIQTQSMPEQKKNLETDFLQWISHPNSKGKIYEQVDDVLVIGIII